MHAIELENVGKEFLLEREREVTLKERFVNLSKKREKERIAALKNINLSVEMGECFGVLGKNGSGKTTLLRVIAGILKPNNGLVKVHGKIVPILTLGLGFKNELTAKENLYIYSSIMGLNKNEINNIYQKIVDFSELEKVMDVKLRDFSNGMIMRLSFSIAFHIDADIILIDETLTAGDAAFQIKCLERIEQLKEEGKTILIVLHSIDDIRRFCDRALILENGEILCSGNVTEVCDKYDEIVKSDKLKRYNDFVTKETGIVFNAFCEEHFVLKTGKACTMELKMDQNLESAELFFVGNRCFSIFSKNINDNKKKFQTDSFPIPEDEYEIWVKHGNKILSERPFKVFVKYETKDVGNIVYMLPTSSAPFHDLTVVLGENVETEAEMFEKGKTIFVFKNIEKTNEYGKACLFNENKVLIVGEKESVLFELIKRVWENLATKHFYEILSHYKLGKILMEIS